MILTWGFMRRMIFGLSLERLDYLWTLFPGVETEARQTLRQATYAFVQEYNTALELGPSEVLDSTLNAMDANLCGFSCEGIGMAMTIIDYFTPWNRHRLQTFVAGAGTNHSDLVHVGAGFAMALLPGSAKIFLSRMNPMQRWLAIDGLGCYYGMFHWYRYVEKQTVPSCLKGYARRAFDQGLGRSIWFGHSADIHAIVDTVSAFPVTRQPDLWSGVGVACTYAGGATAGEIKRLVDGASSYLIYLAHGAATAARYRYRAGSITNYTNMACTILCNMPAEAAAKLADTTRAEVPINLKEPVNVQEPSYEVWRQRIQFQLARLVSVA